MYDFKQVSPVPEWPWMTAYAVYDQRGDAIAWFVHYKDARIATEALNKAANQ